MLYHNLIYITCSAAVQECRDSALLDVGDFVGLAGAENRDSFEVHVIDDSCQEDKKGPIRIAPPRQKPSVSAQADADGESKDNSKGKQTEAKKGKTWSQAIIPLPNSVKVGPPTQSKKHSTSTVAPSTDQVPLVGGTVAGNVQCRSRGPTPPISRHASPVPADDAPPSVTSHMRPPMRVPTPEAPAPPTQGMEVNERPLRLSATAINEPLQVARASPSATAPSTANTANHTVANTPRTVATKTPSRSPSPPLAVPSVASHSAAESAPAADTAAANAIANPHPTTPLVARPAESVSTLSAAHHPHPGSVSVPNMQEQRLIVEAKSKARKRSGTSAASAQSEQKKRRTTANEGRRGTSSDEPPDWVCRALTLFKSTKLGSEWETLFTAWLKFEEASGFQGTGRLGTYRRPKVISEWI